MGDLQGRPLLRDDRQDRHIRPVADAQDGIDAVLARHFAEEARESAAGAPSARVWDPVWRTRGDGRIAVEPEWPDVTAGSRHLALVSYCGQQWGAGCPRAAMLPLALRQNERHIRPPLPDDEVEQVVRSVTDYRRCAYMDEFLEESSGRVRRRATAPT